MRHTIRRHWLASAGLLLFVAVSAQAEIEVESLDGKEVAAKEVLVKFKTAQAQVLAQAEILRQHDLDSVQGLGAGNVLRLHSRSKDVSTLVANLSSRSDVDYAEPNFIVSSVALPNDPLFAQLWGLRNTGQTILGIPGTLGADIGAELAWDISTGSTSTVVGVVDTGVDYNHPDLAGNLWSASSNFTVVIGGFPISCAAGTHGFNAINNTCDPMDDNDHGTHTSGTIGALGNNALGVVGVNWTTSMMALKFLDSSGRGSIAAAVNAIEFSIQAKMNFGAAGNVRVLSNSWGCDGCFSQSLRDEIIRANSADMLFVAAAGNGDDHGNPVDIDVHPFYPASYAVPNVVAVTATDNRDARAPWANFGAQTVALGAPGVNVLSTIPNNDYRYFSGTSMATPHVAGAAALMLSRCGLSTADLRAGILANVDPIPSLAGITITGGRLNVNRAIRACGRVPTVTSVDPNRGPSNGGTSVTIGGTNFAAGATVTFGGIAATDVTFVSETSLVVTTPPHAVGSVDVVVTVDGQSAVLPNGFTYFLPPALIMSVVHTILD